VLTEAAVSTKLPARPQRSEGGSASTELDTKHNVSFKHLTRFFAKRLLAVVSYIFLVTHNLFYSLLAPLFIIRYNISQVEIDDNS